MSRITKVLSFTLIMMGTCRPSVLAQTAAVGRITGSVRDSSGASIPAVSVIARDMRTGVQSEALTNETGDYRFLSLQVGTYSIKASHPGFQSVEKANLRVVVGETLTVNLDLPVGSQTQVVTVTAQLGAIDTTSTTTGTTRVVEELSALPLIVSGVNRNILNFFETLPGVSFGRASLDPYRGAIPNGVGDVSSRNVAGLKIDGLATSIQPTSAYGGAGSVGDAPEPDVVEEFRLVTNQDAENGGDLGTTVQLVTKSGTNQYHGTVWEYLRNNALDSRNFLAKTVAPDKENEFGAAVGGPIIKDKHFFFASYDGYRRTAATG